MRYQLLVLLSFLFTVLVSISLYPFLGLKKKTMNILKRLLKTRLTVIQRSPFTLIIVDGIYPPISLMYSITNMFTTENEEGKNRR